MMDEHEARTEDPDQTRLARNMGERLQELRVAQAGVQRGRRRWDPLGQPLRADRLMLLAAAMTGAVLLVADALVGRLPAILLAAGAAVLFGTSRLVLVQSLPDVPTSVRTGRCRRIHRSTTTFAGPHRRDERTHVLRWRQHIAG